ncbi:MAG: alpha-glucan family phosphorylase [Kiritimatiellae bacterium]|nr:alpha-glucan family phosphorylase [Kiritimatiellia bacterium]
MQTLQLFTIAPAIPEKLLFLEALARNLWWSWNPDANELFRRINRELWKETKFNPVLFLSRVPQERLTALAADESFMAHLVRVRQAFEKETLQPAETRSPVYAPGDCIAYFCAEFGVHESLPLFAGGLGALAGDHLKSASNMGLPLVAVGLLYRQGYFRQYLNNDGWQQEVYPENEIHNLPLERVFKPDGKPLTVHIPAPGHALHAAVWKVQVGRIPIILLDSNIPENPPDWHDVTRQLYGGDHRTRLLQEILLGIGGLHALYEMGLEPQVCHMNEGHSAFISLERLAHLMGKYGLDKKTALEIIVRTNVFTTHTPVAAGHDEFPLDMLRPFFEALHTSMDDLLSLGRAARAGDGVPVSMTVLALRLSQYCNGVSRLHGAVARRMWAHLWPGRPEDEVPITSITNGVHSPSWLSPENILLFDRYLGPKWHTKPGDASMLERIDQIPDEELWRAHELSRASLIRECREWMARQLHRRNAGKAELEKANAMLDPDILTIGFARRFATYKRAGLFLHDAARFEALLTGKTPIQVIFAGKAHPRDNEGKEIIRQIVHFSRRAKVCHRIVFIEDYDIDVARFLVQGVDVWLNTPRRPLEASGTSGMKAAVNGALNVSILDGWWDEAYSPERGWSIGHGEEYQDAGYQDAVESQALYNLIESEVIPCFYTRVNDHLPAPWVKMMKAAIKMAFVNFSSHRMVREYEERFYIPALQRGRTLLADNAAEAHALVKQHARLVRLWPQIRVGHPRPSRPPEESGLSSIVAGGPATQTELGCLRVGDAFTVTVPVHLGELRPEEAEVELFYGQVNMNGAITASHRQPMTTNRKTDDGQHIFECRLECGTTGRYGFTVRIIPHGDAWTQNLPGLMTWAE